MDSKEVNQMAMEVMDKLEKKQGEEKAGGPAAGAVLSAHAPTAGEKSGEVPTEMPEEILEKKKRVALSTVHKYMYDHFGISITCDVRSLETLKELFPKKGYNFWDASLFRALNDALGATQKGNEFAERVSRHIVGEYFDEIVLSGEEYVIEDLDRVEQRIGELVQQEIERIIPQARADWEEKAKLSPEHMKIAEQVGANLKRVYLQLLEESKGWGFEPEYDHERMQLVHINTRKGIRSTVNLLLEKLQIPEDGKEEVRSQFCRFLEDFVFSPENE